MLEGELVIAGRAGGEYHGEILNSQYHHTTENLN
jgi:hypothetical protein